MIKANEFHTEYRAFHTKNQREFINIARDVAGVQEKSGVQEGVVLTAAMHITAGIYINDAENGLIADMDEWAGDVGAAGKE